MARIVHPYLAPVALIMARWLGREGMHGGGVVADGGVWAVLGHKTAGKSTTLASMALCRRRRRQRRRAGRSTRASCSRGRGRSTSARKRRAGSASVSRSAASARASAGVSPLDPGRGGAPAQGLDHARLGRRDRGRSRSAAPSAWRRCCRIAACGSPRRCRATLLRAQRATRTSASRARGGGTHSPTRQRGSSTRSRADANHAACSSVSECPSGALAAPVLAKRRLVDQVGRHAARRSTRRANARAWCVEEQRVEARLRAPRHEIGRQQVAGDRGQRARRACAKPARGAAAATADHRPDIEQRMRDLRAGVGRQQVQRRRRRSAM